MAHLVPEDEEGLRDRRLRDRGVPDDDALGGAEAGDVRVDRVVLRARVHREHLLGRDGLSGADGDPLDRARELRVRGGERLEPEEEGIDHERRDEEQEDEDRQEREPEPQPPAPRALAQDRVEKPDERDRDDEGDEKALGLVPEPRAPALDRLIVETREMLAVGGGGQFEQGLRGEEERYEDGRLPEAAPTRGLGAVAEPRAEAGPDDRDEDEDAPEERHEMEAVAGAGVGDGLLALLGRERVRRRCGRRRPHRRDRRRRRRRLRGQGRGHGHRRQRTGEHAGRHQRKLYSAHRVARAVIVSFRSR